MWIVRYAIAAVLIIALLGFTIQNSYQRVIINIGAKTYEDVPLMFVIFIAFCVGIIFWFVISVVQYLRLSGQLADQKRKLRNLSEELTTLRNLPLEETEEKSGEKS
ncbi:MAG: LapA family protein [candidate division Zixibacteria bacterium]|jgi:uncharacterized integral membrane protein|nr:LapA family protein [candidate division Zixibacteria bacterium]